MFCDAGCPCAKEQGLPGGWEDRAEPSHPSGCTWCEVAAYPASLLPLGCSPPPCLDLVPAWQPMGLEEPSPSASGPLLWRQYYDYDGEEQG